MNPALAAVKLSSVANYVGRYGCLELLLVQALKQVAADAIASEVDLASCDKVDILPPLPDVANEAGKEAQYAPRSLEISECTESISRCIEQAWMEWVRVANTACILVGPRACRNNTGMLLCHAVVKRVICLCSFVRCVRLHGIKKPARDYFGGFRSDRIEIARLPAE